MPEVEQVPVPLRRVHVVGTSGSGKTWLGERLATRLGVPFVDLDAIYHQPGWTPLPEEPFVAAVAEATAGEGWVVAGNYTRARPVLWPRVDAVLWLDLPRRVVFPAVVRRTLWRGITRQELWNGNRERLRNLLRTDPEENVVLWSWITHPVKAREYAAVAADRDGPPVLRLRSRREMRAFLDRA